MEQGADLGFWVAFTAGVLSFFSPCVLPLIPSYLSYITGLSFSQLNADHPGAKIRGMVFFHSLVFVLGFSLVFVALGALAGAASSGLTEGLHWVQRIGGVLIFIFGLHLAGLLQLTWLLGEKRIHIHHKPQGFLGTLVVGLAFAAGWTPCIGPILGSILALAASKADPVRAIWLLGIYSAGLGLPFILAGLLFHSFVGFFNRMKKYIRLLEIVTGVLLMAVGVMLFFNLFTTLVGPLYRLLG